MTVTGTEISLEFAGSKAEQTLAKRIFEIIAANGQFKSFDSPLRTKVSALEEYTAANGKKATSASILNAVRGNPEIFAVEQVDGETWIATTRAGTVPRDRWVNTSHNFQSRFQTPQPKPEVDPNQALRRRSRVESQFRDLDEIAIPSPYEMPARRNEPVQPVAALEVTELSIEDVITDYKEIEAEFIAARTITVPAITVTDVTEIEDSALATALVNNLGKDPRVAWFGTQWMLEDNVQRFGKNDLRRLKDYVEEQERPLTDDVLVQDVLNVRPGTGDFEAVRFALNFRLSRDKDFSFVGTANQRFWSINSLPAIGTQRRKPNDISTDYRYLVDETQDVAARTVMSVDHQLTFYEYSLGLLPYDAEMKALLPEPLFENQRSAVLTFECPQVFTTYLVELRYPAPNRGGFILGLDDFYQENLVPGALIGIQATENDGHYRVEFGISNTRSERLLEFDDRKSRYTFRPTSFNCAVLDESLLTEEVFGGFNNEKQLDDKVRRRPEAVISATFERIGHRIEGPGYEATVAELFAGANVEKPFSESYLRSVLDNDETGAFAVDTEREDTYTYVPSTTN